MRPECEKQHEALSEYLDAELPQVEQVALEAHLATCEDCRRELARLERTIGAVSALPVERPGLGFKERVMRRIAAEYAADGRPRVIMLWARALPVAAMFLAVIGLTLLVNGGSLLPGRPGDTRVAHVREGAKDLPAGADKALYGEEDEASGVRKAPLGPMEVRDAEGGRAREVPGATDLAKGMGRRVKPATEQPEEKLAAGREHADEVTAEAEAVVDAAPAEPVPEDPIVFTQMVPALAPAEEELVIESDRPAELARLTVALANRRGMPASLVLSGEEGKDALNVHLTVPRAQYEELRRELSALAREQAAARRALGAGGAAVASRMRAPNAAGETEEARAEGAPVREMTVPGEQTPGWQGVTNVPDIAPKSLVGTAAVDGEAEDGVEDVAVAYEAVARDEVVLLVRIVRREAEREDR